MSMDFLTKDIFDAITNEKLGRCKVEKRFGLSSFHARFAVEFSKFMNKNGIRWEEKDNFNIENKDDDKFNLDELNVNNIDPEVFLEETIRRQKFNCEIENENNVLETDIELDSVPGKNYADFIVISDMHFGNRHTDYVNLLKIYKEIKNKRYNIAILGDVRENFIRSIKDNYLPVLNQILTPQQQLIWAISMLKELLDRKQLKLIVEGNHDKRSEQKSGIDIMKIINFNVPLFYNRAIVNIKFKNKIWKGVLVHKENGGRSMWNDANAISKALRTKYPFSDFIIGAHTHVPAYNEVAYNGKMIPVIQLGTFNSNNEYSKTAFGGSSSFIFFPVLRFDPQLDSPLYLRGFHYENDKK